MTRNWLTGCAVLAALLPAACSEKAKGVTFDTTLPTHQVMKHIIDPAAIALWGRAGTMDTDKGTVSLAPQTEAEWAAAEQEAAIVAEGGNLLLLPGRIPDLKGVGADWETFAHALTRQALAVKAATAARDNDRMFKAGGDLYQVCTDCHAKYYIPYLNADGVYTPPK
ncbi:MAG: hypothetical protein ABI740_08395 [Alphaproteobacteria bacterium]